MAGPLTARQKQALEFIVGAIRERGCPPTIREMGDALGISSTNGVRYLLDVLAQKGYIRRRPHVSRGIELVHGRSPDHIVAVPLVGRVAAGEPILAQENIEDFFFLDSSFLTSGDLFALRVKGESMIDAGIFDGDVIFARQQPSAENGDIVVAVIGEEATVKRFYPENGRVRLEPANSSYGPIVVERDAPGFRIAGKVVGLIRRM
ncbi:transcriptional repressor LexA [bacterium]|nr:transcriptional repressor LexA [bacterium]